MFPPIAKTTEGYKAHNTQVSAFMDGVQSTVFGGKTFSPIQRSITLRNGFVEASGGGQGCEQGRSFAGSAIPALA
jgi:hypothetical protein